jgi:hypothetical protein
VGLMKNLNSLVKNELLRGAKTIIAVGNDATVNETLNSIIGTDVSFGIIPIGDNNRIAKSLGISSIDEACDIISARRITKVDVGVVNDCFFLTDLSFSSDGTRITVDRSFELEIKSRVEIFIVNMLTKELQYNGYSKIKPNDGFLNLIIKKGGRKKYMFQNNFEESFLSFRCAELTNSKKSSFIINGQSINTPLNITIKKEALSLIVGKNRMF